MAIFSIVASTTTLHEWSPVWNILGTQPQHLISNCRGARLVRPLRSDVWAPTTVALNDLHVVQSVKHASYVEGITPIDKRLHRAEVVNNIYQAISFQ